MSDTSPTDWPAAVAAQIKAEAKIRELTYEDLADRVDASSKSVSRWLSGKREMSLNLVQRFADALDLDRGTLLRRADERLGEQ